MIDRIARVAEGLPDRIISYAHQVYDRTEAAETDIATEEIFRQTFVALHKLELDDAKALSAQSTSSDRRTLRELARQDVSLTPLDLARKLYPTVPADVLEQVADGLRCVLDRVGDTFCVSIAGRYLVADPVRRYALEISMEPE